MPFVVSIEAVPFGEDVSGVWCDECLLPSMVGRSVALVTGMKVLGWLEVAACGNCGATSSSRHADPPPDGDGPPGP